MTGYVHASSISLQPLVNFLVEGVAVVKTARDRAAVEASRLRH